MPIQGDRERESIRRWTLYLGGLFLEVPAIFRLRDHMERFAASAVVYRLKLAWDLETLCDAVVETLVCNDVESAYIRPLAFFGEKTISLAPAMYCPTHVLLAYHALGDYFGSDREHGIRDTMA